MVFGIGRLKSRTADLAFLVPLDDSNFESFELRCTKGKREGWVLSLGGWGRGVIDIRRNLAMWYHNANV